MRSLILLAILSVALAFVGGCSAAGSTWSAEHPLPEIIDRAAEAGGVAAARLAQGNVVGAAESGIDFARWLMFGGSAAVAGGAGIVAKQGRKRIRQLVQGAPPRPPRTPDDPAPPPPLAIAA